MRLPALEVEHSRRIVIAAVLQYHCASGVRVKPTRLPSELTPMCCRCPQEQVEQITRSHIGVACCPVAGVPNPAMLVEQTQEMSLQ